MLGVWGMACGVAGATALMTHIARVGVGQPGTNSTQVVGDKGG